MAFFDDVPLQVGGAAAKAVSALDSKAVAAVKTETGKLIDAAKSGGFRISEDGMNQLRNAILSLEQRLNRRTQDIARLTQAPKLGSHPYGQEVSSHDQKSAANELGSATVVLDQFMEVLISAREALERAAGVYQANEDEQRSVMGKS